jgi:hypothetical protein
MARPVSQTLYRELQDRRAVFRDQHYRGARGKRMLTQYLRTQFIEADVQNHHRLPYYLRQDVARIMNARPNLAQLKDIDERIARYVIANQDREFAANAGLYELEVTRNEFRERKREIQIHTYIVDQIRLSEDPRGLIIRPDGFRVTNYDVRFYKDRTGITLDTFNAFHFLKIAAAEKHKQNFRMQVIIMHVVDADGGKIISFETKDITEDPGQPLDIYDGDTYITKIEITWTNRPLPSDVAPGGCSCAPYKSNMHFVVGALSIELGLYSPKSRDNNCVTACFAYSAKMLGIAKSTKGSAFPRVHSKMNIEAGVSPIGAKNDAEIAKLCEYFGIQMRRYNGADFTLEPMIFGAQFAIGFNALTRPDVNGISHYQCIISGLPAFNRIEQISTTCAIAQITKTQITKLKHDVRTKERIVDALKLGTNSDALSKALAALMEAREQLRLAIRGTSAFCRGDANVAHFRDTDEEFGGESPSFARIVARILDDDISDSDKAWIIDGGAGTGKSYLVNMLSRKAREMGLKFRTTAMTGAAADRIDNACTLDRYLASHSGCCKVRERLLIIDEISMCDSLKFDRIAAFAHKNKVALILVGDNMQLPPVERMEAGFWMQGEFMRTFAWRFMHLTTIRRTQNVDFAALQMRIHDGAIAAADFAFLRSRYRADAMPRDFDLTIASRNDVVDRINAEALSALEGEECTFAPIIVNAMDSSRAVAKRASVIAKHTIKLKIGARIMFTKNDRSSDSRFVNGSLGTIVGFRESRNDSESSLLVRVAKTQTTIELARISNKRPGETYRRLVEFTYFPVRLSYAITIHKSQGLSHEGTLLYICDDKFVQPGMYYTAISRVTDPANLTISGKSRNRDLSIPSAKMLARDNMAIAFANGEYVPTISEMHRDIGDDEYFAPGIDGEPLTCETRTSSHPRRVFYFDFETAVNKAGEIEPYVCSHMTVAYKWKDDDSFEETTIDRGLIAHGVLESAMGMSISSTSIISRIAEKVMALIHDQELFAESNMGRANGIQIRRNMRKHVNSCAPVISAYNGSSFDFYFLVKYLLSAESPLDSSKYSIRMIMKGAALVGFSIVSIATGIVLLRAHDLCQVLIASLKNACEYYLPKDDPDNKKIEYHEEIMHISAHYFANDWMEDDLRRDLELSYYELSPEYTPEHIAEQHKINIGERVAIMKKKHYKPLDVLAYCARDTDVLPKLYATLNKITSQILKLSSFTLLTAGGMAWYGAIHSAKPMLQSGRAGGSADRKDKRKLNLYSLNASQDKFARQSIIGGRSCPRIIYGQTEGADDHGHIYVDISGMYMSILERASFPHGKPQWIAQEGVAEHVQLIIAQAERLKKMARKNGFHPIHYAPMGSESSPEGKVLADFWIADIEFQENEHSLEPVLPVKTKQGTFYNLARRTARITSYDLLLILLNGGTYFGCGQMLHFPNNNEWMGEWSKKCRIGKQDAKKAGNSALTTFWKLMANASYGQMLKRDHNSEYRIVERESQLYDFLDKFDMNFVLICLDSKFDIVYGSPRDAELGFMTTRPTYVGSFVLAYTRAMVQQIVQVANPDANPAMQPALGDTDSLLVPYEGAMRLRNFRGPQHYIGDGVRIADTDALGWFPPNGRARAGQLADELLDTAFAHRLTGDPKLYDDVQMEVVRWFSPAPKVLACIVRDPITRKLWTKFRAKGVTTSSVITQIDSSTNLVMSAGALFRMEEQYKREHLEDGQNGAGLTADIGNRLKKIAPSSVSASAKNTLQKYSSAFTIREVYMKRKIISHRWNGRAYIGEGITVPFGWR